VLPETGRKPRDFKVCGPLLAQRPRHCCVGWSFYENCNVRSPSVRKYHIHQLYSERVLMASILATLYRVSASILSFRGLNYVASAQACLPRRRAGHVAHIVSPFKQGQQVLLKRNNLQGGRDRLYIYPASGVLHLMYTVHCSFIRSSRHADLLLFSTQTSLCVSAVPSQRHERTSYFHRTILGSVPRRHLLDPNLQQFGKQCLCYRIEVQYLSRPQRFYTSPPFANKPGTIGSRVSRF
jgi:hypothetical protein